MLLILALTFLISPLGLPAQAMLIRELQFGKLYLVQLVSSSVQVAASITLALLGFSYLSMAWASLVGGLAGIAVLSVLKPDLVFMTPSLKEWRRIAAFGGFASGANLVGTIGVNMAELIIGRMLGFSAVAYYSRAMGLLNIFRMTVQATVMSVALPAFADQYRAGIDMRPDYGRAAALMTGLAWPFYGMLALLAQPVIRLLYGRQWDEAVVIAQILCVGGAVMAVVILGGPLLTAIGQVRANLWREIAIQVPRAVFTLVAALHSLEAVAVAQVAAYLVALAITQVSTRRFIGFGVAELVSFTWRSLALTAVTLAAASLPLLLLDPVPRRYRKRRPDPLALAASAQPVRHLRLAGRSLPARPPDPPRDHGGGRWHRPLDACRPRLKAGISVSILFLKSNHYFVKNHCEIHCQSK